METSGVCAWLVKLEVAPKELLPPKELLFWGAELKIEVV